eukprot:2230469-Alexandrium_andersonii.AAC.1
MAKLIRRCRPRALRAPVGVISGSSHRQTGISSVPWEWLRGLAAPSRALQASDFRRHDRGTSRNYLEHEPLQSRELRGGRSSRGDLRTPSARPSGSNF